MGFFDKLKAVTNFITGGGAIVTVQTLEQVTAVDKPFAILVRVAVKDTDLSARRIYLQIRATEQVHVDDVDTDFERDGRIESRRESIDRSVVTYQTEIEVAGSQTLQANQVYEFETEILLPDDVNPSYYGQNARHIWEVYAAVDVTGNDPDSGWHEFELE
jgi:hypothetical protein